MDIIDGIWIEKRLTGARGEKAQLADAMGIRRDMLSKILKGERAVKPQEMPGLLQFFGEVFPQGMPDSGARQDGFAEDAACPYLPSRGRPAAGLAGLPLAKIRKPERFVVKSADSWLGLLAGDILIVELNGTPGTGDIVLATETNTDTGESTTHLRRFFTPWLIAGDHTAPPIRLDTSQAVAILGIVRASFRSTSTP